MKLLWILWCIEMGIVAVMVIFMVLSIWQAKKLKEALDDFQKSSSHEDCSMGDVYGGGIDLSEPDDVRE